MSRYIKADKEYLEPFFYEHLTDNEMIAAQNAIDEVPTADVEEVRHGKFISEIVKKEDWRGKIQQYYQPNSCSNCHTALKGTENYCPECGAKMDGE